MIRSVYQFYTRNEDGEVVPSAEVRVNFAGGAEAPIFTSESGGAAVTQPLIATASGKAVFYVEPGAYDIETKDPVTLTTATFSNEEIGLSKGDLFIGDSKSLSIATTENLIALTLDVAPTTGMIIDTKGYSSAGDGGGAQWKFTGVTGQTPSQSPIQLGENAITDGSGNKWFLVDGQAIAYTGGKYFPSPFGDYGLGIYDFYDNNWSTTDNNISIHNSDEDSHGNIITPINNRLSSLEESQQSGVIVFQTYSDLTSYTPTTAEERGSFKVVNDLDPLLNGYYSWVSGTTYIKDASLVESVINENNTSDAVSGSAVENYTRARSDIAFTNAISESLSLIPDMYLGVDGLPLPFPGGAYSLPVYVYSNGIRTIRYSGRYGAAAVGLLFRDIDGNIISFTTQPANEKIIEDVSIPASAYTVELSTTKSDGFEVTYNETNITELSEDLASKTGVVSGGLIELPINKMNDVYLDNNNELVSFAGGTVWEAQSVVSGETIRYDTKYGSAAVGLLFLNSLEEVISTLEQASNAFSQGFIGVPDTAVKVRFSTTDNSIEPVFSYVNNDSRNQKLSGLSWDAIGDSITEGSQIKTEEGISKQESQRLVYCGLIAERSGMAVVNNGMAGTRIAAFNPYGRTVSYLSGGVVIGYDEIHYLPQNTALDGRVFNTPAGCDSIRLTIEFTDPDDSNNSISDLSSILKVVLGSDLTGANLYNSANNIAGAYINYNGELNVNATSVYVDIPVSSSTEYALSDVYEFTTPGAFRYNSFVERISDFLASQSDIKTIMGGTNDRNDYVIGDDDSISPYEFKGALNLIAKSLLDDNPMTRLGLITVLRFNTQSYIDELAQAMLDIGDKWSIPVLDMRKKSGLNVNDVDDFTALSYDKIHPNIDGNLKISYKIESFISEL